MTHYEQFLVAYAREEWDKVIDLYTKYHDEFPPCDNNIYDSIYTVAQIEFYSC